MPDLDDGIRPANGLSETKNGQGAQEVRDIGAGCGRAGGDGRDGRDGHAELKLRRRQSLLERLILSAPSAVPRWFTGRVVRSLSLFLGNVLICLVCGAVVHMLEFDHEQEQNKDNARKTAELEALLRGVGALNRTLAAGLRTYAAELLEGYEANHHWTFAGSAAFWYTVMTTIGYGFYAPLTSAGQSPFWSSFQRALAFPKCACPFCASHPFRGSV